MKRIVLMLVAIFMIGGLAMAQNARRGDKMPDPKARAERMTERMVKEYSLDDSQKKQLLEVNMELVKKMGEMPPMRRNMRKDNEEGKKPQMTSEQRAQKKAEGEKKIEEMKTAREEYDTQIKKIMTKEQYKAYDKNMQERKTKMGSRRRGTK